MRVLTGLQPSGRLHLGNYFASIKQMVDEQNSGKSDMFMFIANYHAMTSVSDASTLRQSSIEAAAAFMALGIDPGKCTFWMQSDVKEVLELYWVLSQYTPMGLLERAHSYKDKVAKGIAASHGLFSYPVLMAADILLFSADVVPVGKDQIQHVEIARDVAIKFNNEHGEILRLPEHKVAESVAVVPGIDGAKMSKSYKNTIDIFCTQKELKKRTSSIVTDSTPLEEPKQWQSCNVYALAKLFLDEAGQAELRARYERGGEGYGHFKAYLAELVWEYFAPAREKYEYFMANQGEIKAILASGAAKAREVALPLIEQIRAKTGIY
ncbi:tryptophan--tRNA ligase [Campylobacter sp. 19-13652]|uniref:tryptophan--tRNA ligase n=1 Tax=Campylobacter sp. 19-13652 TaxID=2840180 RepID=UPI001C758465|nr:tryptophan--tRNA ligase [Campylobacter sp. 19-13652]BCX79910.1 tryptophan--tRNA ligase [Campylobacter sp. 19-13652]